MSVSFRSNSVQHLWHNVRKLRRIASKGKGAPIGALFAPQISSTIRHTYIEACVSNHTTISEGIFVMQIKITYETHGDESFDPDKQLRHCLKHLFSQGLLTGDSSATVDGCDIYIDTKELTELDVDFLVAYGDGTWQIKQHKVLLDAKDLRDAAGCVDLRKLDPCIDELLEETYYDSDVVAMVPYWIGTDKKDGLDASLGTPTPVFNEKPSTPAASKDLVDVQADFARIDDLTSIVRMQEALELLPYDRRISVIRMGLAKSLHQFVWSCIAGTYDILPSASSLDNG